MINVDNKTVSLVNYQKSGGGTGIGSSLEKIDPFINDDSQNHWAQSIDTNAKFGSGKSDGTLGEANSVMQSSSIPEFSMVGAIVAATFSLGIFLVLRKYTFFNFLFPLFSLIKYSFPSNK